MLMAKEPKDKEPELPRGIQKAMAEGKSLAAATVEHLEALRARRYEQAREALRVHDEKRKRRLSDRQAASAERDR